MTEFLTTDRIPVQIEKIISGAGRELFILFPYLQMSQELYLLLKGLSDRGVPAVIVYANEDLYQEEKLLLGELSTLEIYMTEKLNAKCCCSEDFALVTSMDLHKYPAAEGCEMGVLFDRNKDNELYKQVYDEIKSVISSSKNMDLHKRPVRETASAGGRKKIYHGFCIRCAMPVSYNTGKPYCRKCMPGNEAGIDNKGGYCHMCGTESSTNADSPLCELCVKEI